MGKCLYVPFWNKQLPFIKETILSGRSSSKRIDIEELRSFSQDGNRDTLRFRVSIEDGIASTKTNSAIARDLKNVLNANPLGDMMQKGGVSNVVINLINGDTLNISLW